MSTGCVPVGKTVRLVVPNSGMGSLEKLLGPVGILPARLIALEKEEESLSGISFK